MRLLLLLCLSFSSVFAQSLKEQLTSAEYLNANGGAYIPTSGPNTTKSVKLDNHFCEEAAELRRDLWDLPEEERLQRVQVILRLESACSVRVREQNGKVAGFEFENDSKNAVNPRTAEHGSSRSFYFEFDQRNKRDINLNITENSGLTGKLSHDLLETKILFVPRRVVPYIDMNHDQVNCAHKVILPTNEYILFDAITKEIIGGVLEEAPMDMTESRHQREFAGISYTGNGIMIRADRRAGTPEHTYNVSYNVNEKIRDAVITHKGKECIVNKNMIWENTDNPDTTAFFKYASDQEFLDTVINPICGWNLMMDDII